MRCLPMILTTWLLTAGIAQPADLAFHPGGEGAYSFDTGVLRGQLRLDGRVGGIDQLIHVPSGKEIAFGAGKVGLLSYYRIFSAGKRFGEAARAWPTENKLLADGGLEAIFLPKEEYPFQLKAVFRIAAPDAIDAETIVAAKQDLPSFEVFLSNYFAPGFDASVYVVRSLRAPGKPFFVRADHNPLVDGNYLAFPRDRQAVLTIFDGRWEQPPSPVEWCINRYLAAPLAIRRDGESGLTALVMSPPSDCFAVSTPYNQTPPDGVADHRSLYLSLFGLDVAAGQTIRARSRLQIIADPSDAAAEKAYEDYVRVAGGK